MQVNTKFLVCSLIYMGSLSANAVGSSSLANETVHVSILSADQTKNERNITGRIIDGDTGEALIGVSILVKGASMGTVTDVDGKFSLSVATGDVLEISYIGYKSQSIVVGNQSVLDIRMMSDNELLDEVVVVGYGSQKKVNLTGSVATVNFDDKTLSRPVTTLASTLSGMVAGLNVMQTSSKPNSESSTLRIRGTGTLNDSAPLVLVDGMEMSLNNVNPNDIASISILKDAASCAIYGNRGANGVILLTTKKGTDGKINVTYSGKFSYNTPANLIRMVSNYADYMEFINEASDNAGQAQVFSQTTIDTWRAAASNPNGISESGYPNYVAYPNTDWYDEVYNPKLMQEHSITLTGAEKRTRYSLNATYVDNPGLVVNSGMKKYYMRSNLESQVASFLAVGLNAWGYHVDQERNNVDDLNGLQMQKSTPGTYPYYDGKYGAPEALEEDPVVNNPVYYLNSAGGSYKTTKFFVNPYIKIDFLKNFHLTSNFYYDHYRQENLWHYSDYQERFSFQRGETMNVPPTSELLAEYPVKYYIDGNQSWKNTTTLNWGQIFKGKHDVAALVGYEEFRKWARTTDISKKRMLDTSLTDFDALTEPDYIDGSTTEFSSRSVFGRVTYTYDSRYLFEANVRYDGSSRFPSGNRFGFFPSMSAGYRISEEPFMQSLKPYLSTLKIRGSWGMIGNQDVGTDRYISTLSTSVDSWIIDGKKVQSTQKPTIVSSTLTWEKVTTLDLGLDARFFNDALGVTFDWYNRTTSDILTTANLPATLGADAPYENMGTIQTKGWELAIDYRHTFKNGLHFGVTASVADDKTEVTKWTYNTKIPSYGATGWWDKSAYKEGMVLGDIWGLQFDRFLTEDDFNADGSLKAGLPDQTKVFPAGYQFAPGDVLYKDLDNNGEIVKQTNTNDKGDLSVIGNALPRLQFGLNLDAAWKGFDISMFFQGVAKRKLWAAGNQVLPGFTTGEPFYKGAEDYWTPENTDAFYPRPMDYKQSASGNYSVNDRYLLNMAYLRLKTFTVGYSLPKVWLSKFKVQGLRVYFTGENLFTIDGVKPAIDPEIGIRTASGKSDQRNFGRSYPYQKTVSFGIQLSL